MRTPAQRSGDFADRSWFTPPPHARLRNVPGADEIVVVDEFRIACLHLRDAGRAGMVVDSFGYGLVDLDVADDDAPTVPLARLIAAVGDEAVRRRA